MRGIDFQDSLYRSQPVEKVQARVQQQNIDEQHLNQLKKGAEDEIKDKTTQQTEQGDEPRITDREKRDREFRQRERRRKKKEADAENDNPQSPRDSTSFIDLQA
ncbi:MAG: hypothetical protein A2293_04560 [Elusimicrobia bacterium RIFOXYB2_FULL_49_7]|nr:MAG: hypothetical protein A2293_04560 [Elusimicrobia bacterium RIFOXYB2_FULL_49_7]